jgi:hypothetical protein
MPRIDELPSEKSVSPRSPGFLLTPFGWAAEPLTILVDAEPRLLADLFAISRPRMHLIALALAHLDSAVPPDIGPLLLRGSVRQVLDRAVAQRPAGIKRVLSRLPVEVLRQEDYRLLVNLLADSDAAKVLHHAESVDSLALWVLDDLPGPLRKPLAALPGWRCILQGFAAGLQFLVARGLSFDALVVQLASVTTFGQLAATVEAWVGALPLPETMPPARFAKTERLDEIAKIRSLARDWQNCLADYRADIDAGTCAVYLWTDTEQPAACLTRRHGRLGWFLHEVKGPRNAAIEPGQREIIATAFASVGVPNPLAVRAIERIIEVAAENGLLTTEDER